MVKWYARGHIAREVADRAHAPHHSTTLTLKTQSSWKQVSVSLLKQAKLFISSSDRGVRLSCQGNECPGEIVLTGNKPGRNFLLKERDTWLDLCLFTLFISLATWSKSRPSENRINILFTPLFRSFNENSGLNPQVLIEPPWPESSRLALLMTFWSALHVPNWMTYSNVHA